MAWIKVHSNQFIDAEKVFSIFWEEKRPRVPDKSLREKKIVDFFAEVNVGGENSPRSFNLFSYDFTSEYISWIQSSVQKDIQKIESELNALTMEYEKCKKEKPDEFPDIRYQYPKKSEELKREIEKRKKLLDLPRLLTEMETVKDNSTRYHTQLISDILSAVTHDYCKELDNRLEDFANPVLNKILNRISGAREQKQNVTLDFSLIMDQ
jgi:hypothetical protein